MSVGSVEEGEGGREESRERERGSGIGKGSRDDVRVPLFLRDCLHGSITNSQEVEVKCPFMNEDYQCDAIISEREIRGVREHDLNTPDLNTPDHDRNMCDHDMGDNAYFFGP